MGSGHGRDTRSPEVFERSLADCARLLPAASVLLGACWMRHAALRSYGCWDRKPEYSVLSHDCGVVSDRLPPRRPRKAVRRQTTGPNGLVTHGIERIFPRYLFTKCNQQTVKHATYWLILRYGVRYD